ncbi:MAG TPA: TonB-dependent receptor plug domain-containing protein, partial [Accumulibacter sp.]|nr:TonB-dependent receptor plug domain-containing protein [Accumulibacter sp.]
MTGHLKIQSISSLVAIAFCNAPAAEENIAPLSTIEVRGDVDNGYVAKRANSATKTDTPILDTPMAIQVITRDVLDDQQTLSIQEAVKNVSGVQTPPGVYYDNFLIRGFSTGSDTFRNGLKLNGVIGTEDMAFVDHVDVVKGPASMLYGRIQPGGLVNIVTRKPQDETAASLQQQVGSWGLLRTTADITGPANKDKTLLYRVMGVYDQADNFIDYQHHKNAAGAAYLSWLPSSSFQANLQLEYYDQKVANPGYTAQQIPIIGNRPADVPRHWTQNDPVMWSQWPNTVKRTTAAFDWTYAFNDSWKLTQ